MSDDLIQHPGLLDKANERIESLEWKLADANKRIENLEELVRVFAKMVYPSNAEEFARRALSEEVEGK